jgi:hypothetical protein
VTKQQDALKLIRQHFVAVLAFFVEGVLLLKKRALSLAGPPPYRMIFGF